MKNVTYIHNAQIVLENGILWDGALVIEDGIIAQFGSEKEVEKPIGAEVIDAQGVYVGPGFVDIHVHGGGGFCTCFEAEQAAAHFLAHGETSILATSLYIWEFERFMEAIRSVKDAMKRCQVIKGFYMEGPFINVNYGAWADQNPWRDDIVPEKFQAFVDAAGTDAKVWTVAPERTDLKPFMEYARKVNPNVVFSVGHSNATPMQIRALGKYRPTLQTHSMNATHRQPVYGGTRGYGPDEYCFKEPDVYTELISDSCGIHVHPELQQLLLHNKGIGRIVLVTDSTNSDSPNPPHLAHIKDLNFDPNGGIAGSKMTMDLACRNIMTNTNCGIAQAFLMASTNPARVIGMDEEIGSVAVGKKADLVFVDDKFTIKNVLLQGVMQY